MTKKRKPDKNTDKQDRPQRGGHPLWKGFITFGLVNIPVALYSAEKGREEVHFKMLDKKDLSGIKYVRVNEKTGKEVPWEDIVKGYEYETGSYAVLTDKDFENISRENMKTIEIEDFIDREDLNIMYFEKPYYLLPDKGGEKGYILLREILKKNKKMGLAKVMIRMHQYLAAITAQGNALVVDTLRYPQEVKTQAEIGAPTEKESDVKISKKEFDIAQQLVDTMTIKWDPSLYRNEYKDELVKIIEQKVAKGGKGEITHVKKEVLKKTNVIDFMDLLKKSLKEKQKPAKPSKPKAHSKSTPKKTKKRG